MRALALEGQLACYRHDGFWRAMDTLRDRNDLERAVALRRGSMADLVLRRERGAGSAAERGHVNPAHPRPGTVDPAFWRDRRVLLTGHTGFKGAWLALWLQSLGARVTGFSSGSPTRPSLYELARVGEGMESIEGDVCDPRAVAAALAAAAPDVVIHMAAQPLVRRSFAEPRQTFQTT